MANLWFASLGFTAATLVGQLAAFGVLKDFVAIRSGLFIFWCGVMFAAGHFLLAYNPSPRSEWETAGVLVAVLAINAGTLWLSLQGIRKCLARDPPNPALNTMVPPPAGPRAS